MLACILFVFGALVEYAAILFRRQTTHDEEDIIDHMQALPAYERSGSRYNSSYNRASRAQSIYGRAIHHQQQQQHRQQQQSSFNFQQQQQQPGEESAAAVLTDFSEHLAQVQHEVQEQQRQQQLELHHQQQQQVFHPHQDKQHQVQVVFNRSNHNKYEVTSILTEDSSVKKRPPTPPPRANHHHHQQTHNKVSEGTSTRHDDDADPNLQTQVTYLLNMHHVKKDTLPAAKYSKVSI